MQTSSRRNMHNEAAAARPDRPRSTNSDESPTSLAVTHHCVRSIDELAMPQVIFTASLKAAIWGLTLRAAHGMVSLKLPVQSQLPQRLPRPRQLIVRLAHATGSLIRHASRLRHLHFRLVCGHVVSSWRQDGPERRECPLKSPERHDARVSNGYKQGLNLQKAT